MMTPPSSPPLSPASPPLSPTSPTSSTSNVDADAASSPSSSAASSTPLRRRLFALGGLFQKVAASPLSPRRSQAPLKHVASSDACWEEAATDNEDHPDVDDDELDVVVEEEEEELLFAPATVDERLVSSLLPVSSPPEWHQLPAHILELIVESALLPENELTTPWKERAVSIFFFFEKHSTSRKRDKRSGISSSRAASEVFPTSGLSTRPDSSLSSPMERTRVDLDGGVEEETKGDLMRV